MWFLAGVFGGGTATRNCQVPDNVSLFFPVINYVNINTPNVCGQGPTNIPVGQLRAPAKAFIDGASDLGTARRKAGRHATDRFSDVRCRTSETTSRRSGTGAHVAAGFGRPASRSGEAWLDPASPLTSGSQPTGKLTERAMKHRE